MQKPKPTEKELEILQILWEKGSSSVRDVHEGLGGDVKNGYTTILKMMQIMHEKGLLTRQKNGKLHLYKAETNRENTQHQLLSHLIDNAFQGSASQLILSALGRKKSSPEELNAIRKYLDQLEGGKK